MCSRAGRTCGLVRSQVVADETLGRGTQSDCAPASTSPCGEYAAAGMTAWSVAVRHASAAAAHGGDVQGCGMTACAGMPPAQRRQYTRREQRRHSDIGPALLFALMLAMAREVAGQAECPAPEDAGSMETGQRGIDLIKAGDIAEAASCFWRASDRSGSEQEAAGWLKNAAQASEQLNEVEDAVEAWQQMFDTQLAVGITPDLQQMVRVPPLLLQLNRPQQAVNAWAQVAEVHAASAEVKASYAVTLHQLGLLKEAVVLYEQALELKPDLEAAYVNAAMALRELGETARADAMTARLEARRAVLPLVERRRRGWPVPVPLAWARRRPVPRRHGARATPN